MKRAAQQSGDSGFGVSFSVKQCRGFDIDSQATLKWLIKEADFRRFRLMSYWNEHEKQPEKYDFKQLDWQIETIAKANGTISLCLGAKQPRWPESHWPDWAWQLPKAKRDEALLAYIEKVLQRYKGQRQIASYQLENEALLDRWGERAEVDRQRLIREYDLVKHIDPGKPLIMTTSTSWGIPIRQPIPDIVGFSYYKIIYRDDAYHQSLFYPWVHQLRKGLVKILHRRPVFIHELQLEPWGPQAIWKMSPAEQDKSMSTKQIATNIQAARQIQAWPIDLWGGEWWYWRLTKHEDPSIWWAVKQAIQ